MSDVKSSISASDNLNINKIIYLYYDIEINWLSVPSKRTKLPSVLFMSNWDKNGNLVDGFICEYHIWAYPTAKFVHVIQILDAKQQPFGFGCVRGCSLMIFDHLAWCDWRIVKLVVQTKE